jgi:ubiquinone/menaquinone biosynthesis C-methylase UbiE
MSNSKSEIKKHAGERPKSPFPVWASFLLTGLGRHRRIDRQRIIDVAGIKSGDIVLELGCGPGFFTETIAERVGDGKVIAQDIQERMLTKLLERAQGFPRSDNIEPLLANSSKTGLDDASIDIVFAANVFEEIAKEGEIAATAREIHRVLKPAGRLFFGEHRVSGKLMQTILRAIDAGDLKGEELPDAPFFYAAVYRKEQSV